MGIQVSSIFSGSTLITFSSTAGVLAGLASGSSCVSPGIPNISSSEGAINIRIYYVVETGTSPTANGTINFYLLQGDANPPTIYTDNAPTSSGAWTPNGPVTAALIHVATVTSTSNTSYYGSFVIRNPGPYWGFGIQNNTGAALNATFGNFLFKYVTESIST